MPAPDPASPLAARIRAALVSNEGAGDPYRLSYAGLGNSGASFGVFQGDCNASGLARSTLFNILIDAGSTSTAASAIVAQMHAPCAQCPLNGADEATVLAALRSPVGQQQVDAMDGRILASVLANVGMAIDAAAAVGMTLADGAAILVALWANMTGVPATLDRWIGGETIPEEGGPCPPPVGPVVTQADVDRYLGLTAFFTAHPRNLAHLRASCEAGMLVCSEPSA